MVGVMFDAKASARLNDKVIIWMTTVDSSGQPQTSPVWFLWDGEEFWIYSLESARARNVEANPKVALNLDGNGEGGDIVTIEGVARIDRSAPSAKEIPAYLARYQRKMDEYEWTWDYFCSKYKVPIRIRPTRVRT
jgi:PPOX class probable F420-dependent enzyme